MPHIVNVLGKLLSDTRLLSAASMTLFSQTLVTFADLFSTFFFFFEAPD